MTTPATPATPAAPDLSSLASAFRGTTTTAGTEAKDETYKRIIGKRHVPDIGKGSLMFRFLSMKPEDFGHYMQFWLNIGLKDNGDFITIPRVSPLSLTDFIVNDGRGGTRIGRTAGAAKGCLLSKLAENNHPVIALSDYKDSKGAPRKNIDAIHAAPIQLIERRRDAQGRAMKNADGSPAFVVKGEMMFLGMPQSWWDQFVNLIDPAATPVGADDDLRGNAKAPKPFPTTDLTRVIWMVTKEKRIKNPTGNVKTDVDYVFDFAGSSFLKDADMVTVVDPIDLHKAFVVASDTETNEWVKRADAGWPKQASGAAAGGAQGDGGKPNPEDDPANYGRRVGEEGAAPEGAAAPAAPAAAAEGEEQFQ